MFVALGLLGCSYYYPFLKVNFRFQVRVCNGCHYLMQKVLSFLDRIHFWYMSKNEVINIIINASLTEKRAMKETRKDYKKKHEIVTIKKMVKKKRTLQKHQRKSARTSKKQI